MARTCGGSDFGQAAEEETMNQSQTHEARQSEAESEPQARGSVQRLVSALELIASKSMCDCWDAPGMGSGLPYVWRGCRLYHSKDPNEFCLCCIAHAALRANEKLTDAAVSDAGKQK